jgi:hypothetical protein
MTKELYSDIPFPASLYAFTKIKDMNDRKEVQLLRQVPGNVEKVFKAYPDLGMLSTENVRKVLPEHIRYNPFRCRRFVLRDFQDLYIGAMRYSITGGTCRNELLGIDAKTDIDVVVQDYNCAYDALSMSFRHRETSNTVVEVYETDDNTIHTIPKPYIRCIEGLADRHGRERLTEHVFVDPMGFDFTINCACISTTDGWLYAPPATLHDINRKVLRASCQLREDYDPSMLLKLPLLIRVIRFALKYDMHIHNDLYVALNAYFTLQRDRNAIDDKSMYHGLKHLYNDSEDLRKEFYSIFRKLNVIETEKFANFDDYFKYIKGKVDTEEYRSDRIRCRQPEFEITY